MARYLVKFVENKYMPDFKNLNNYSIRIGSFLDYKKTEDLKRQDRSEGQRGLQLTIKRPCSKLDDFIAKGDLLMPEYTQKELDDKGNFIPEVHIIDHEHLEDFNAWIFCCSIVDNIEDIEKIKNKFNADDYYFISDIDKFINTIQHSLSKNLQNYPNNKNNKPRIQFPKGNNIYMDGYKNIVTYSADSKYMNFTSNTLTEYLASKNTRTINMQLWFNKGVKFQEEKEFRFILSPSSKRDEGLLYNIDEMSCLLNVNLNDCISQVPVDIEI